MDQASSSISGRGWRHRQPLHGNAGGSGSGAIGLAFTEAKNWIGEWSDDSNGAQVGPDVDEYFEFLRTCPVTYVMPDEERVAASAI